MIGWSANCTALLPPPECSTPEAPVRLMVQKLEADAAAAAAACCARHRGLCCRGWCGCGCSCCCCCCRRCPAWTSAAPKSSKGAPGGGRRGEEPSAIIEMPSDQSHEWGGRKKGGKLRRRRVIKSFIRPRLFAGAISPPSQSTTSTHSEVPRPFRTGEVTSELSGHSFVTTYKTRMAFEL